MIPSIDDWNIEARKINLIGQILERRFACETNGLVHSIRLRTKLPLSVSSSFTSIVSSACGKHFEIEGGREPLSLGKARMTWTKPPR